MLVVAADTDGHEFVADVDEHTLYVDHRLNGPDLGNAIARGALALFSGAHAVPGARRLNGHLSAVPDAL